MLHGFCMSRGILAGAKSEPREVKPVNRKFSTAFSRTAAVAGAALLIVACTRSEPQSPVPPQNRVLTAPTGATIALETEDGQWTMPAKNYASTRFSGLEEINTSNVANLKLAWTFSTGVVRGHEAAPIVVNNVRSVASAG